MTSPRAVSAADARAGLAARVQGLRDRYAGWQSVRDAAAERPEPPAPPAALVPPPPDAPDGEITQQREEAGQ